MQKKLPANASKGKTVVNCSPRPKDAMLNANPIIINTRFRKWSPEIALIRVRNHIKSLYSVGFASAGISTCTTSGVGMYNYFYTMTPLTTNLVPWEPRRLGGHTKIKGQRLKAFTIAFVARTILSSKLT